MATDIPDRSVLIEWAGGDETLMRAIEDLFVQSVDVSPEVIDGLIEAINSKQDIIDSVTNGQFNFVSKKEDFPSPVGEFITLPNNTAWIITADVDLEGSVLVADGIVSIGNETPEIGKITSTGKPPSLPLLQSSFTLALNNVGFHDADYAISLTGGGADPVLDWRGVNFVDCPRVGDVSGYGNAIFDLLGILNSADLVFDGTFGTLKFTNTFFSGLDSKTTIKIADTAIITRRIDIFDSAFFTPTGGTALDVSVLATIPDENYILRNCNFSGVGSRIVGVQHDDNKAAFVDNSGISNSTQEANYYMIANATATPITSGTPAKLLGTTTEDPLTERFTHTNNRMTYTGAITRKFYVDIDAAFVSNNNNVLVMYVAKNGVPILHSGIPSTANAGGRAESMSAMAIVSLETGDFIETWADNNSGNNAITAENLNVIIMEST